MQNLMPVHANAALNNAARLEVDLLDVSVVSADATDRVHARIAEVARTAEQRFYAALSVALNLVPEHLHDAAREIVSDLADDILCDRYDRAQNRRRRAM